MHLSLVGSQGSSQLGLACLQGHILTVIKGNELLCREIGEMCGKMNARLEGQSSGQLVLAGLQSEKTVSGGFIRLLLMTLVGTCTSASQAARAADRARGQFPLSTVQYDACILP